MARPFPQEVAMRRVLVLVSLLSCIGLFACAPEGPTAFVTFNLVPSSGCIYTPQTTGNMFYPIGRYDISSGGVNKTSGAPPSDNCANPYLVNLLVNSYLRPNNDPTLGRAEPDVLQLHSAEVRLTNNKQETISFDRVTPALPNPFLVNTANSLFPAVGSTPSTGVAAIEAIPKAYASQLDGFVGSQILAHIQIFGTTTGDIDINFKPFVYPIEICDGCLTLCQSDLDMHMKMRSDITKDRCDDNSGSDDRVCIDPDC
jgi:hypothetical protein